MKNSIVTAMPLMLLLAACGATSEKAAKYNNALVQLQEDLYYLNDSVDSRFVDEVWYYEPDDSLVGVFMSEYEARYDDLAQTVADVDDLSGHNDMKEALAEFVGFCSDALDTYYLALIKDAHEGGDQKEAIDKSYNDGFTAHENKFIDAQKALAEEFNLSFAFEEEVKH
jgi:hypothetical protein